MHWNPMSERPKIIAGSADYPDGVRQAFSERVLFQLEHGGEAVGEFWVTHFRGGRSVLSHSVTHAAAWRFLSHEELWWREFSDLCGQLVWAIHVAGQHEMVWEEIDEVQAEYQRRFYASLS